MAGTIIPGQKGRADDFIFEADKDATPANDEGRVAKLEDDGKISREFIHLSGKNVLVAGEAINGSSTPKACFIASAQRLNKYGLVANQKDDTEVDFEMYNAGGGTDRRIGHQFNSGLFDFITGFAFGGNIEGGVSSHNYILELFAVDGSGHPTGAAIASKAFTTDNQFVSSSNAESPYFFIEFDSPVSVSQSTDYVFVIRETTTTGSSSINLHIDIHTTGGTAIYSTNGGSSWSDGVPSQGSASFAQFVVYGYKNLVAGRVYQSDADDADRNYFDGFVKDNVSGGANLSLLWGTDIPEFTGLLPGSEYFISTTAGGITATKGKGKKVGKANGSTRIVPSERMEISDQYDDDVYAETRAVADALIFAAMTDDVDMNVVVGKYHEVLFGKYTQRMAISANPTGNQNTASFYVRQGEHLSIAADRNPNTWDLYADVKSKVRYHL